MLFIYAGYYIIYYNFIIMFNSLLIISFLNQYIMIQE